MTTAPRPKRKRSIKITLLIILAFLTIQMLIYSLFHLEKPHTLMERATHFGVTKCVVTYFPSILAFGKLYFDSTDNPVFINKQIHKNAQATTVLLASLCRDEYNKVSGLDNDKQIWDTLKFSHEGNDTAMITKMELVEGELGRFTMIRGEEPI
jgi:flagellar basal body-associated protein FliL